MKRASTLESFLTVLALLTLFCVLVFGVDKLRRRHPIPAPSVPHSAWHDGPPESEQR